MDDRSFDTLARQLGRGNRRGFLKALLGIGGGMLGAEAVSAEPQEQVSLCHATGNGSFRLITVAEDSVAAHLAHGDGSLGTRDHCTACGDACTGICLSTGCCNDTSCFL